MKHPVLDSINKLIDPNHPSGEKPPSFHILSKKKLVYKKIKIIAVSIILITLTSYRYRNLSKTDQTAPPTPFPIPTGTPKLLPSGSQTYNFSHGKEVVGPKPSKAIINPINPRSGDTQTFTVEINHPSPVIKAVTTLITDNDKKDIPLKLIAGTSTDGTWEASWGVNDTYYHKYRVKLSLSDGNDTFSGGLTFR